MSSKHQRIEQLEAENRELKAQLTHFREVAQQNEQVLTYEKERLQALGDNFPNGTLFRLKMDMVTRTMSFDYVSATWEKIFEVPPEEILDDINAVFDFIEPADLPRLKLALNESAHTLCNVDMEIRYRCYADNSLKWLHLASHPHREGDMVYSDGFILDITERKLIEQALIIEKERLQTLGDYLPSGALFRIQLQASILSLPDASDIWLYHLQLNYASASWEKISNVPLAEAMQDFVPVFMKVHPDDRAVIMPIIYECLLDHSIFNGEVRYIHSENNVRWQQISVRSRVEGEWILCDGFILDITNRKIVDNELALYRDNLERLVKEKTEEIASMNEELAAANEEMETVNEELRTANEEMMSTNDELSITNDELSLYKTQLELMVEMKTREQTIIIKVLQIMQLPIDIPNAINTALAEIGKYTDMSRVYILENDSTNNTVSNTYEWCNKNIVSVMGLSQQIPLETLKKWYDIFERDGYMYSGTTSIKPITVLKKRGYLSVLAIPLLTNGVHYGILGFDECVFDRHLSRGEINMFISLSRIIANNMRRHVAETAIYLSQQTMRTVLDNIDAVVMVSDFESYEILFANKKLKELMGNVEGHVCWQVVQEGMTAPCKFCPKKYLRDKDKRSTGPYHWEYRNTKDNEWYACNAVAAKWVDGRWVHMEYAINITHLKNTEMELIDSKEKAEESDRLKSAFLANMSHEIRTPLNGITGFLNFLEDDNLTSTRRREYINIVNSNTEQFIRLVDDIVDVSTIEAGQMNLLPVSFRLNEFMEEMYSSFDAWLYAKEKPRTVMVLDRSGFIDNCTCFIDSVRLRQTLSNLIDNAIKFLDKGYVCFGYRQKEPGILEFVVEDTGVGIPENQQKTIFERFRQGKSDKYLGGTGLGLTISRNLAQMMGGDIRVESTEGLGSTFYLTVAYLPVVPVNENIFDPFRETQEDAVCPFAGKTVFLSESLDMKYTYYEKMFSAVGFSVVRTDVQQRYDIADMTRKADVLVVSLSENGNTEHNITGQSKIPVIYIVPPKLYNYYLLTLNNPYSMVMAEPVDFDSLTMALMNIMK